MNHVPPYEVSVDSGSADDFVEKFEKLIDNPPDLRTLPSANSNLIEAIRKAVVNHCSSLLEIDVNNRLPQPNRVHLLDYARYYQETKRLQFPHGNRGFFDSVYGHIFIRSTEKDLSDVSSHLIASSLNHEYWHSASLRKITVNNDVPTKVISTFDGKMYFKEALIELSTMITIKYFWKDLTELNKLRGEAYQKQSYLGNLIVLDRVIVELMKKSNKTYRNVVTMLQTDLILGGNTFANIVSKFMGEQTSMTLLNMPKLGEYELADYVESLGIAGFKANEWRLTSDGLDYVYCKYL